MVETFEVEALAYSGQWDRVPFPVVAEQVDVAGVSRCALPSGGVQYFHIVDGFGDSVQVFVDRHKVVTRTAVDDSPAAAAA